jgi:glycosyltransferase involved in cell wall biosynthesis
MNQQPIQITNTMRFWSPVLKQIQYPSIEPAPADSPRPFWSVMLTSYKRTEYLEQALRSVLAQAPGIEEMQIEVVDDCSPNKDEIEAIVKEVGQGKVSFYSSPINNGIFGNWNVCIQRARGHWVHILSDDDIVMPGFYEEYRHCMETHQSPVVLGQSIFINEYGQWIGISEVLQSSSGLLENALWILSKTNPVRTPAVVVAREVYEKIGGFTTDLVYTPDWEMLSRLAASVRIAYVNRPYSLFRMHSCSETNRLVLSATSITDTLDASRIIQTRFSNPSDRKKVQHSVNRWLGNASFFLSSKLANERFYQPALLHAFWAFRLIPSISSFRNIANTLLRILRSLLRQVFSGHLTHI